MSDEREKVEHPSWCDREACTAPEFRPTNEEYKAGGGPGGFGEHVSKMRPVPGWAVGGLELWLSQGVAPWVCRTFLRIRTGDGELYWDTEVGEAGEGFWLYELLGQEVKDSVREWPRLYAERFPYVQRAIEDEADEATADAAGDCDTDTTSSVDQESETQDVGEMGLLDPMPLRLTVNGAIVTRGTLQEVRAAVAELVTKRLAEAPERVALDAQTINMAFNTGAVQQELDDHGIWLTILDVHGEDPARIRITKEGEK